MSEDKLTQALNKILRPTNQDYYDAHKGWWDTGLPADEWQPLVFNYPRLVLIGSAHSHTPGSPMLQRIQTIEDNYFSRETSKNEKLVMVEGYSSGIIPEFHSLDQAITHMGESGMTVYLARQNNIKVISPEVEADRIAKEKLKADLLAKFSPEQLVLYYWIESIGSIQRKNQNTIERVAAMTYDFSKEFGASWIPKLDKDQEQRLEIDLQFRQSIVEQIRHNAFGSLNELCKQATGMELFTVEGDVVTVLLDEEMQSRVNDCTIFPDADHPYASFLNDIARIEDIARDNYLVTSIYRSYQQSKDILIVFGGSHILAIKPAIDSLISQP